MSDYSGLKQNDTLQEFYNKNCGRLPTSNIQYEIGNSEDDKPLTECCKSSITYSYKHKENVCSCCGMTYKKDKK